ncbi:IS66 family insertion sequence element accessory protein TnpA [uncultured Paludibaculum sp.]|uniref:IS66 family insertion sequence element accessory protein TnpA n=1 Tax=uncultured Paludibaculum sp. TaxID=1765020 RepID=UPI002AAAB7FC|nr:hypothetical protein [uncultured Paludibaculum sp.]
MRTRGPEVWTKWRELIAEQERSGQSAAAFCRARGLSPTHFFAWKKRLILAGPQPFVEVHLVDAGTATQTAAGHGSAIEIRLPAGRSLLVEPGFDPNHLRALLAVLESRV